MTKDDVLFGYRLRLFDRRRGRSVRPACRAHGGASLDLLSLEAPGRALSGLEMLRPEGAPGAEDAQPDPGDGGGADPCLLPRAPRARPEEDLSPARAARNGVGSRSRRTASGRSSAATGSTPGQRLALVAGYGAPYEPPHRCRARAAPRVLSSRRAGRDRLFLRRPPARHQGSVWQLTASDTFTSYAWAELVVCQPGNPTQPRPRAFARRVARELRARRLAPRARALRQRQRVQAPALLQDRSSGSGASQSNIYAGRPQTNGHVERLHRTILEECWRPAFARYLQVRFTGLREELEIYLDEYNHRPRAPRQKHTRSASGRPRLRCPQDGAEMSRRLSGYLGVCSA